MANFVSGLYVGTFGGRTLNINVTGNISRNSTTVTLTNISCYLYSTDGGTWWAQANRTWGLRAPGGEAVSTSVPYTPSANHRTFSLPNLSFYLANTSTSCTMNVTGPDGSFAFTLGGIPQGAVAPSGLDVTLSSVQDTGATMRVTLNSYGTPSGEANRYIEASIMGQSTYGGKYRWATKKAVKSATITVNNSSATNSSNPLTIVPNTKYWYGAYATNTALSTSMVKGTFITLPAYISNVVVDDTDFLETLFDLTNELFDIVVIKKRPKNGVINIEPFKLLWEKKIDIHDIYGGYMNTKEFFLQDLVENMKTDDEFEDEKVKERELPHTEKLRIEDIKDQIDFIVNKPFNYYEYSELDGSNDRFMRKQKNTNQLSDPIFDKLFSNDTDADNNEENTLF